MRVLSEHHVERLHTACIVLLAGMVVVAAVRQMQSGWADWQARPAQSFIEAQLTRQAAGLQDSDRWRDAVARLERATELDPDQAGHHLYLGLAYFVRIRGLSGAGGLSSLSEPYLEECLFHVRRALELNRHSGRAQAALAVCKGRLGQWDAEFEHAIASIRRYAPLEPAAWGPALSLAFAAWQQLDRPTRVTVAALAQRVAPVASASQRQQLAVWLGHGGVCRTSPDFVLCSAWQIRP